MTATGRRRGRGRALGPDAFLRPADTLPRAREEIARALAAGATLEEVDERIIARRRMTADARDSLWLFAWTELQRRP